ncbi:antifreeze protein Maxi-like [Myotis daubentonii]|uniref:antifreeze protein Maxi-like n=1 Tax=Myotis daubentonii TaxID=98922 RepID=UPI002873C8E0|nr:antifreeze protein Maxi-like [Myotis daubentonii]
MDVGKRRCKPPWAGKGADPRSREAEAAPVYRRLHLPHPADSGGGGSSSVSRALSPPSPASQSRSSWTAGWPPPSLPPSGRSLARPPQVPSSVRTSHGLPAPQALQAAGRGLEAAGHELIPGRRRGPRPAGRADAAQEQRTGGDNPFLAAAAHCSRPSPGRPASSRAAAAAHRAGPSRSSSQLRVPAAVATAAAATATAAAAAATVDSDSVPGRRAPAAATASAACEPPPAAAEAAWAAGAILLVGLLFLLLLLLLLLRPVALVFVPFLFLGLPLPPRRLGGDQGEAPPSGAGPAGAGLEKGGVSGGGAGAGGSL